jgi:hypothetical protein
MVGVLHSILECSRRFLLNAQDEDGFWRDYLLQPGISTAWTTACVGRVLTEYPAATQRARMALLRERRPTGWGYNMSVSTDADSTAWVLRFMARTGDACVYSAMDLLKPFITGNGAAQTFRNANFFGTWADEHADVTPAVGLALIECTGDSGLTDRIRRCVLDNQRKDGSWNSFWWSTDAYATAKSLEFLNACGGIPEETRRSASAWLAARPLAASSFEAANLLAALVYCGQGNASQAQSVVEVLMDTRNVDGSWPASNVLLVPDQHSSSEPAPRFRDIRSLMSTSAVLEALHSWQSTCGAIDTVAV